MTRGLILLPNSIIGHTYFVALVILNTFILTIPTYFISLQPVIISNVARSIINIFLKIDRILFCAFEMTIHQNEGKIFCC